MIVDLWRVGKDGIYSGPHLVRRCGREEAARVVKAHNFYRARPAQRAPELDDPSDDVERIGQERDDAARAADPLA